MKYPGLVHCHRCGAQYRESDNWCAGWDEPGTTGVFHPTSRIPREHCPFCRNPPLLTAPIRSAQTM